MIPFIDLNAQYLGIKLEIDTAINKCISEGNFVKGKPVSDFERSFSDYLGMNYCLGCGNGTDALEIIIKSLGIGPGDEVIVPALTWISTAEAVSNAGAEPVFADIDPSTYTINTSEFESRITNRTRAVIPVHLYGCPSDMGEVMRIALKYNLHVIEDCAQSHGAEYYGKKTGTFGIASAFSFFPTKNLGAFGDGGAIVTNSREVYEKAKRISNHGQLDRKHEHSMTGRNSRLDTLQAAILNVKLSYLDKWNSRRREIAQIYISRLSSIKPLILPVMRQKEMHVFHLFVIRTGERKKIQDSLDEKQISWGIHYPEALPFVDAYKYKGHLPSEYPVSDGAAHEILSLPIYPELTDSRVQSICDAIDLIF